MGLSLTLAQIDGNARGVLHMAPSDLRKLGLDPGQTARLTGTRETYVRVVPGKVTSGQGAVDAATLQNARLDDTYQAIVTPHHVSPATSVTLQLQPGPVVTAGVVSDALVNMALCSEDSVPIALPGGKTGTAVVLSVMPQSAGMVTDQTDFVLEQPQGAIAGYEEIGGLSEQISQLHDMIAAPLSRPDLFRRLGVDPPRGVLFSGPPGSGKTLLARTVAARTKAAFFQIDGPEIVSKHYGDSEAALRRVFDAAAKAKPAIIFIDELDAIAPRRDALSGEKQVERRVVAQLLTLMDGLADRGSVVVMAATNIPDALDPALRRPGRFDREIVFTPPTPEDRLQILAVHLKHAPLSADADLDAIARQCHGYVGADLAALAREAAMASLSRAVAEAGDVARVALNDLFITQADLDIAVSRTAPSVLRADAAPPTDVQWDDIGGLTEAKAELHRAIIWPRQHGATLRRFEISPTKGVLLSGPPGTGKTLAARALAYEADLNFILVRPPTLLSQYLGEAERGVAELFLRARQSAPSLLFFDEFDALAPRRGGADTVFNRIVAQFLVELDGMQGMTGVTVLAATNRADAIDPALLRPGRFDTIVPFKLPDQQDREDILRVYLQTRPVAPDLNIGALAHQTEGASGADLEALVRRAALFAAERDIDAQSSSVMCEADFHSAWDASLTARAARKQDFIRFGAD